MMITKQLKLSVSRYNLPYVVKFQKKKTNSQKPKTN